MPSLDNWLKWGGKAGTQEQSHARSADVEFMRGHLGTSVVLLRGSTPQAAQTVRIGQIAQPKSETSATSGTSGIGRLALIGLLTFNVQRGDRFVIGTARYEVILVDSSIPGRIEAHCEAVQ